MSNNMKLIVLIIFLIGTVAVSNSVRMKVKARGIILNSHANIDADFEQVSLSYLKATDEILPANR